MTIKVAAYIRVSTDEQAEQGISMDAQKNRIVSYCHAQGWELYDFYQDDGWSGKNLDRPAMQRLLLHAKSQKFDNVVVIKLDRLSRRQKDVLYLLEDVFEPNKIGFKSVTEPFDTTTPFGKAAIGMMAVFAQLERETIVERIKIAKKEAARQGRYMGGLLCYGYTYNPSIKKVQIDEDKANIIRFIFNEYLSCGHGYQYIADLLNEKKIPPPGNSPSGWIRSAVSVILHNPFYAGYIKYEDKLNEGQHQAIITREDYFATQKLQNVRSSYNAEANPNLLTGLIFCGECGARMRMKQVWVNPKNPVRKQIYYVCYSQDGSSKVMIKDRNCKAGYKRAEQLEQAIIKELIKYSSDKNRLKEIADQIINQNNDNSMEKSMEKSKKEVISIKSKLDKWYSAFENDIISADDLGLRIKDLRDRRNVLNQEIFEYEKKLAASEDKRITVDNIMMVLKSFNKIWISATPEEQRGILCGLVNKIHIFKDNRIKIEFI